MEQIKTQAEQVLGSALESSASVDAEDEAALTQFLLRGLEIEENRCEE